jgi:hypothetical protein
VIPVHEHASAQPWARRVARTLTYVAIASPASLIMIPIFVGLLAATVVYLVADNPAAGEWCAFDIVGCSVWLIMLITFTIISIAHLTICVISGWKGK